MLRLGRSRTNRRKTGHYQPLISSKTNTYVIEKVRFRQSCPLDTSDNIGGETPRNSKERLGSKKLPGKEGNCKKIPLNSLLYLRPSACGARAASSKKKTKRKKKSSEARARPGPRKSIFLLVRKCSNRGKDEWALAQGGERKNKAGGNIRRPTDRGTRVALAS